MTTIIKALVGLFIWMVLPVMLSGKKGFKKYKRFINVACAIVGIAILVFAGCDLLQTLIH